MRYLGIVLLLVGIVLCAAGSVSGCGKLFTWNGRHPVAVHPLVPGTPLHATIDAQPNRYTLAVQVVFDRTGLVENEGAVVVDAKFPLVATIKDSSGTVVRNLAGWLDPHEPPSVLYGQAHGAEKRHAPGAPPAELYVERLVGPYPAAGRQTLSFDVDLGQDRIGTARVSEARVVVYDDAIPASIKLGFGVAIVGAVSAIAGALICGLWGIRKFMSRRGGIRRHQSV